MTDKLVHNGCEKKDDLSFIDEHDIQHPALGTKEQLLQSPEIQQIQKVLSIEAAHSEPEIMLEDIGQRKEASHLKKDDLSFIDEHEVEEAKRLIEQQLGFKSPRVTGYHMAVKIYIRSEDVHQMQDENGNPILGSDGKPMFIALPEQVIVNDKWRNCVGLVIAQGAGVYKGPRFEETGPWCNVGDWIIFPRNEGTQINYRGVPMQIIPDDRCIGIIEDPTFVTRD